jgi:hypothetical protein
MHVVFDLESVVHHVIEEVHLDHFGLLAHVCLLHLVEVIQQFEFLELKILVKFLSLEYQSRRFQFFYCLLVEKSDLKKGKQDNWRGNVGAED